jgi:Tfp pilus assembly protein PilO
VDAKGSFDNLTLDLTAKTYRYLDEDEVAAAEQDKRTKATPNRRPSPQS